MTSETILLIANILSTLGALVFLLCAILKRKDKIIFTQSFAYICFIISEIFSFLWANLIQDLFSLLRNTTIILKKNTKNLNIIFVILSLIIGIGVNILGKKEGTPWYGPWYGYLAVIANLQFSIISLYSNNPKTIKLSLGISCILFGLSFIFGGLIISGIINSISGILCYLSLIFQIIKEKKEKKM